MLTIEELSLLAAEKDAKIKAEQETLEFEQRQKVSSKHGVKDIADIVKDSSVATLADKYFENNQAAENANAKAAKQARDNIDTIMLEEQQAQEKAQVAHEFAENQLESSQLFNALNPWNTSKKEYDPGEAFTKNLQDSLNLDAKYNQIRDVDIPLATKHGLEKNDLNYQHALGNIELNRVLANKNLYDIYQRNMDILKGSSELAAKYTQRLLAFNNQQVLEAYAEAANLQAKNMYEATVDTIDVTKNPLTWVHYGLNRLLGEGGAALIGFMDLGVDFLTGTFGVKDHFSLEEAYRSILGISQVKDDFIKDSRHYSVFDQYITLSSMFNLGLSMAPLSFVLGGIGRVTGAAAKHAITASAGNRLFRNTQEQLLRSITQKQQLLRSRLSNNALAPKTRDQYAKALDDLNSIEAKVKELTPTTRISDTDLATILGKIDAHNTKILGGAIRRDASALGAIKKTAWQQMGGTAKALGMTGLGLSVLQGIETQRRAQGKTGFGLDDTMLQDIFTGIASASIDIVGGYATTVAPFRGEGILSSLLNPLSGPAKTKLGGALRAAGDIAVDSVFVEGVGEAIQRYFELQAHNKYALPDLSTLLMSNTGIFAQEQKELAKAGYAGFIGSVGTATSMTAAGKYLNREKNDTASNDDLLAAQQQVSDSINTSNTEYAQQIRQSEAITERMERVFGQDDVSVNSSDGSKESRRLKNQFEQAKNLEEDIAQREEELNKSVSEGGYEANIRTSNNNQNVSFSNRNNQVLGMIEQTTADIANVATDNTLTNKEKDAKREALQEKKDKLLALSKAYEAAEFQRNTLGVVDVLSDIADNVIGKTADESAKKDIADRLDDVLNADTEEKQQEAIKNFIKSIGKVDEQLARDIGQALNDLEKDTRPEVNNTPQSLYNRAQRQFRNAIKKVRGQTNNQQTQTGTPDSSSDSSQQQTNTDTASTEQQQSEVPQSATENDINTIANKASRSSPLLVAKAMKIAQEKRSVRTNRETQNKGIVDRLKDRIKNRKTNTNQKSNTPIFDKIAGEYVTIRIRNDIGNSSSTVQPAANQDERIEYPDDNVEVFMVSAQLMDTNGALSYITEYDNVSSKIATAIEESNRSYTKEIKDLIKDLQENVDKMNDAEIESRLQKIQEYQLETLRRIKNSMGLINAFISTQSKNSPTIRKLVKMKENIRARVLDANKAMRDLNAILQKKQSNDVKYKQQNKKNDVDFISALTLMETSTSDMFTAMQDKIKDYKNATGVQQEQKRGILDTILNKLTKIFNKLTSFLESKEYTDLYNAVLASLETNDVFCYDLIDRSTTFNIGNSTITLNNNANIITKLFARMFSDFFGRNYISQIKDIIFPAILNTQSLDTLNRLHPLLQNIRISFDVRQLIYDNVSGGNVGSKTTVMRSFNLQQLLNPQSVDDIRAVYSENEIRDIFENNEAFKTKNSSNKVPTDKDIQNNIHNFRELAKDKLSKNSDLKIRIKEALSNDTDMIRKLDILLNIGLFIKVAQWLSSSTERGKYKPFLDPMQLDGMVRNLLTQEATEQDIIDLRNMATELAVTYLENSKVVKDVSLNDMEAIMFNRSTIEVNADNKAGIEVVDGFVAQLRRLYGREIKDIADLMSQVVETTNDRNVAKHLARGLISRMPICNELRNLLTMQMTAMELDDTSYDAIAQMLFEAQDSNAQKYSKDQIVATLKNAVENDSITAEDYNNMKAQYVNSNAEERKNKTGRDFVGNYIRIPQCKIVEGDVAGTTRVETTYIYVYLPELAIQNNTKWKNEVIGEVSKDTSEFDRELETEVHISRTNSLEDVSEGILDRIENRNSELGMALFMLANKALNESRDAKDESLSWLYDSDVDYSKPVYNLVNVLVNGRNGTISSNTPQSMKILRGIFTAKLPDRQFTDEQLQQIKDAKQDMNIVIPEPEGDLVIGGKEWLDKNKPNNLQELNNPDSIPSIQYKNGLLLGMARALGLDVDKFTNTEYVDDGKGNKTGIFQNLLNDIEKARSNYVGDNGKIKKELADKLKNQKNKNTRTKIIKTFLKKHKKLGSISNADIEYIANNTNITLAELQSIFLANLDESIIKEFVANNKGRSIFKYISDNNFDLTKAFEILTDEKTSVAEKQQALESIIREAESLLRKNTLTEDAMGHQLRIIKELKRYLAESRQNGTFDITNLNPNEMMIYADGLTTFLAQGSIRIKHPVLAGYLANMYSINWNGNDGLYINNITLDMFEEYTRQFVAKNDLLSKLNKDRRDYVNNILAKKGLDTHTLSLSRFLISLDTFGQTSLFSILSRESEYLDRSTIKPINNPVTYGSQWKAMLNALKNDLSKILFKTLATSLNEFANENNVTNNKNNKSNRELLTALNRDLASDHYRRAYEIEIANRFINFLSRKINELNDKENKHEQDSKNNPALTKQEKLDRKVYESLLTRYTERTDRLIDFLFKKDRLGIFSNFNDGKKADINLKELQSAVDYLMNEEQNQYIAYYSRFGIIVETNKKGNLTQKSLTEESLAESNKLLNMLNDKENGRTNEIFFYNELPYLFDKLKRQTKRSRKSLLIQKIDDKGKAYIDINDACQNDVVKAVNYFNNKYGTDITYEQAVAMIISTEKLYQATGSKFYEHSPLGLNSNPVLFMQRVASGYVNKSVENVMTYLYDSLARNSYELLMSIGKKYGYNTREEIASQLMNNKSDNSAFIQEVQSEQIKMYRDYLQYFLHETYKKGFFVTLFKEHPSENNIKQFDAQIKKAIDKMLESVQAQGIFNTSTINPSMENTGSSLEAMDYKAFLSRIGFVFPDVNGLFNHNLEGLGVRNIEGIFSQTFDSVISTAATATSANRAWGRQSEIYDGNADGAVILTGFLNQIEETNNAISKKYGIDTGGVIKTQVAFVNSMNNIDDIIKYLDNIATIIKYLLTVSNTQTLGSANILSANPAGQFDNLFVKKNQQLRNNIAKTYHQQLKLYKAIIAELKAKKDPEVYGKIKEKLEQQVSFLPDNTVDINMNNIILNNKLDNKKFNAVSIEYQFTNAQRRANAMLVNINDVDLSDHATNATSIAKEYISSKSLQSITNLFGNTVDIQVVESNIAKISWEKTIFDLVLNENNKTDRTAIVDTIISALNITDTNLSKRLHDRLNEVTNESIIDTINNSLNIVLKDIAKKAAESHYAKKPGDKSVPIHITNAINNLSYTGSFNVVETTEEDSTNGAAKDTTEIKKSNIRARAASSGEFFIDEVEVNVQALLDAEEAIMRDVALVALKDNQQVKDLIKEIAALKANLAAQGRKSKVVKLQSDSRILTPIDNFEVDGIATEFVGMTTYDSIITSLMTEEQKKIISDNLSKARGRENIDSENISKAVDPGKYNVRGQRTITGEQPTAADILTGRVKATYDSRGQVRYSNSENTRYENGTYKSVDNLMADLNSDLNDMARQNPHIAQSIDSIRKLINDALAKTQSGLKVFYSNNTSDAIGEFDPNTNTIIIYKNSNQSTRLHEFIHAITEFALHDDSNEAQILISKMRSIQQQIKQKLLEDDSARSRLGLNNIDDFNYVFGDNPNDSTQNSDISEIDSLAEFMATFLSEPNKIEYLQNTEIQLPTFRRNPNGGKTVLGRLISAIPELCKYLINMITSSIDRDSTNAFILMNNIVNDLSNYNNLDVKQKIVEANDNKWINRVDRAFAKVINSSLLVGRFNIEKYAKNKGFNEAEVKELISEYAKEIDNSFILEHLEKLGTMAKKINNPIARNLAIATWLLSSFIYKSKFLVNNPIQRSVVREAVGDLRQRVIEGSLLDWKILGDFGLYGTEALKKSMNLAGRAVGLRANYNWQVEQAREAVRKHVDTILTRNPTLAKYLEDKTIRQRFEIALDKIISHQNLGSFFINEDIINSKDLQRLIQYTVNPTMHLESIRNEAKANINEALTDLGIDIDSITANSIRKVVVDLANTRLTDTMNKLGSSNIEMVLKQAGYIRGNLSQKQLEAVAKLQKAITLETIALPVRQKDGSMNYFKTQTAAVREVLYGQNTELKAATIEAMTDIVRLQAEQLKGVYKQRVLNTKANAFINKENKHSLYYLNNDGIYDETAALDRNSGDAYYLDSKKWYAYNNKRNIRTLSRDNIPEGSTIEQERAKLKELGYIEVYRSESGVEVYSRDSNVSLTSARHTAGFVFKNYNHKGQVSYLINERDVDTLKPIYNDEYNEKIMGELNFNYGRDYTEDYLPKTVARQSSEFRGLAGSETIMRDNSLTNKRFEELIGAKQTITDTLVEMEQDKQENQMRDFVNNQIFYQIIDAEAEIRQRKSKKLKKDEVQDSPHHHSEILFTIENGRLKFNESLIDKYGFELTKRDVADFAKLYNMYHKSGTANSEVYIDSRLIPIMFGFNKLNYGALVKDRNNKLYKAARYIQAGVESILREAKNTIIIRNPKLVLINALGNFYGLVGEGIPLMTAAKSWRHYVDELNRYKQDWAELEQAKKDLNRLKRLQYRNKASATRDEQIKTINSLELKIKKLTKDIDENKVTPLVEAGMYTNIVEDAQTEGFKYYDTAVQLAEDITDINDKSKELARNVMLTENSQTYKVMADMTRAGDFIPRVVLYYHILSKELPYAKTDKEVEAIKSKALDTVRDRFINYNMPMQSAIMRGLEGAGLVMFSKYRMAVQYQIAKVFAKSPVKAASIVALEYMLSSTGMNINPVTSYLAESIMLDGNLPNGMYNLGPGSVIGSAINRWEFLGA